MSWSDKLSETARQGAARLSRSEGQLGRLVRLLVPEVRTGSNGAAPERYVPGSALPNDPPPTPSAGDGVVRRSVGPGTNGSTPVKPLATPEREAKNPSPQARRAHLSVAALTAVPAPAPGDLVAGAYQVLETLAAGPRYSLYRAHRAAWSADVVLKVPTLDLLRAGGMNAGDELLDRAARWTSLGVHPHLVYCHEATIVAGVPVLVLEHADGGSLAAWLADGRAANPRIGLNVAIQVCHSLEALHRKNLRYGAIAAAHVLVSGDGMVKLTNGGWAVSLNDPRPDPRSLGSLAAPEERVEDAVLGDRADVFALGVFLYEMLCGHAPYDDTRGAERPAAPPRFVSPGDAALARLGALLVRMTAWRAEERPADVVEVRTELCGVYQELLDRRSPFAEMPAVVSESDGWNNRAMAAHGAGDAAQASAAWESALSCDPRHLDTLFNYGVVRWRRGEISDEVLIATLERAYSAARGDWRAAYYLGLACLERDDTARALVLLEEARGIGGEREETARALAAARAVAPQPARRDLAGHRGFVSAVRISPDGARIVSASDDHTLCVWDASTGRPFLAFEAHSQRISALDLDGAGMMALSGAEDALLKLWDLGSGQCLETIETPGAVFSCSLSADASRAASSSSSSENFLGIDNTVVHVWDVARKRVLAKLSGHTSATKAVAISADGSSVVTGSDDQTVRVWDAGGGPCRRVLQGHVHYVSCVLFAPDGRHVLSGSWDQTIRLWDIVTGRCLRVFEGGTAIVTAIALSADGKSLVSGSWDGTVRVWEIESGRCRRTFRAHGRMVTGVALSADGRTAASGSWDSMVRLWSAPAPGRESCALRLSRAPAYAKLPSAEPEPDELVDAALRAERAGDHAAVFDAMTRARQFPEAHDLPEARRLWRALSLNRTRSALAAARPAASLALAAGVERVMLPGDPARVLIARRDGRLELWDTELERRLYAFEGHQARVLALAGTGRQAVSASADATLRIWDLDRGSCSRVLEGHASLASSVSAAPDFQRVLSGSYDHTCRLWDVDAGTTLRTLTGHARQVTAVSLSGDASLAAAGAYDGSIRVWRADAEAPPRVLGGHAAPITDLRFSADATRLLSAGADGALRWWDLASGQSLRALDPSGGGVLLAALTPDGSFAFILTADGRIRLWTFADGSERLVLDGADGAALSADGCRLAVLDRAGKLHLLDLDWELA